ncbi:unnamed protein product [Miscanthus lutarioriparius]|uniref:Uncharacterized protein n=1 Tax=Miscanthus lutarioriparius TaxID=422564 RepID=A0A811QWF9_9POAL|nr:unnamed protein product [Miscanthus lutarioriparius]
MAALGSSVTSTGLALHTSVILRRRHGNPVVSASSHHQRSLNGLATNSSGMNNALPIRGTTTRIPAVGPSPANPSPSGGNLPIPKILPLAKWVFSAAIFAVPMYRRFRTLEADKIEKTAEVAIEVIDKVAEATEKVADEVAEEFPGNESIKKAASKIKKVMDVIEEDADKAEALIEKVRADLVV